MVNSRGPCSPLTYRSTVETFNKKSVKDAQDKVKPELGKNLLKLYQIGKTKHLEKYILQMPSVMDKAKNMVSRL